MDIRESTRADDEAIVSLHRDAFGVEEGDAIAQLVLDLFDDETARPLLSLVAKTKDEIVGHVLFTAVTISAAAKVKTQILAPLGVRSDWHGTGVGTALIDHGLDMLRKAGVELVLVLGDPAYYSRAGFRAGHKIATPHPIAYPEAWMVLALSEAATAETLNGVRGTAQCARALSDPKHW